METEEKTDESQKQEASVKVEAEEEVASCHACGVCGRSFPLLSSLSQHMRRHTREKPYKCPYCEHRTAQKGSLKAHIRSHKLGLFSHNLSDKEAEREADHKEEDDAPLPSSDKVHVNGKVKKKASKKKVKSKDVVEADDGTDAEPVSCTICGQVFPQVLLLKSHMKRHRGSQDHGCRICGRRFRQAWFLQSHMRIHRVKAQMLGSKSNQPPATINGVPQDSTSLTNEECLYELCAGCGNFFNDRKTLQIHEKLHRPNQTHPQKPPHPDNRNSETNVEKKEFLESLNLRSVKSKDASEKVNLATRIVELDPVCSYQAWQLATRGRLVEVSEKCLGWEERLADAEVVYDTEKGEYIPLKQEKKRKQIENSNLDVKKKKGNVGLNLPSKGDKKICPRDRILLNGLGHAFYEALQTKKVKDVQFSSKNKSNRSQEQEDKKFSCENCEFHTSDFSLLKSHLHTRHPSSCVKTTAITDSISKSSSKASRYMDYLRSRSALLSQPYWTSYVYHPSPEFTETNIKKEKSNWMEVKEEEHAADEAGNLLNLSSTAIVDGSASDKHPVKTEGLVRHLCPYCSHTTNYPEVLWIHQRVAHRVDGNSSMAPKWAPCINGLRSLKAGSSQWRRTGPPPFLEGKDCPALPTPRTQRTQPPGFAAQSTKNPNPKIQSGIPKSRSQLKDSHSSDGKAGPQTQRKSVEHKRAGEGGSRGVQSTSSNSSVSNKSLRRVPPANSPKLRHSRSVMEGNFPPEGLGFMLARSSAVTTSKTTTERQPTRRQSCDFSSASKGSDFWAAMNMWGLHNGKTFLDPLLFAQGKNESTGESQMDIDVLNLLKSYSPHDLAALYQHWGFVDPRLDPQALLQLNGNFASEVHSSADASKQMSSRSSSSSGSLHKGT